MRILPIRFIASRLFFVAILNAEAMGNAAATPLPYEIAKPRAMPPGAPKASDVMMRSLKVHPTNANDPHDTLASARAFHVTRLDWMPSLSREFVEQARAQGLAVSGSASSSIGGGVAREEAEGFSWLDLNGARVLSVHKRGWKGQVEGCLNNPDYVKWYRAWMLHYIDLGCAGMQRDEPEANLRATPLGACFCKHCVMGLRRFLAENTTPEQRAQLGIEPLESFDYAAHLRQLGAPVGDAFGKWNGGELKQLFIDFQSSATVAFHEEMRRAVNDHAGRVVPWSCNNGARRWGPCEMVFDYFIGELAVSRANPKYLHELFRSVEALGKSQVVTMPLTGEPIVGDSIRPVTRKTIATVYALGGLCMVPWDTYMPKDQPRYFGRPEDYADLYGFARAMAEFLDGYEYVAAYGSDLPAEAPARAAPAVRLLQSGAAVYAFVRARPGQADAPVVIHLVNWSGEPAPFSLELALDAILGNGSTGEFTLLAPAAYDAALHERAAATKSYRQLSRELALNVAETKSGGGARVKIEIPALHPWGVLVVSPAAAPAQGGAAK